MTSPPAFEPTLTPYGDSALMIAATDPDPAGRRRTMGAARRAVETRRPHGVVDLVAGLESLLVEFDPLEVSTEALATLLRLTLDAHQPDAGPDATAPTHFTIPVLFDDAVAPDLAEVAAEQGLDQATLVERFASFSLSISLLAAAMAPMMDGAAFDTPVSRCTLPRTDVAAGSIMVAGANAIIQPFPGPTGWKVIGRTPLRICDIARTPPTSYRPGDTVRFVPIDAPEYDRLAGRFLTADTPVADAAEGAGAP
ncbi:5-oxoprolinase subunit B family protein [Specibacter cremeus]|uniref:5-oxoprolinase subunit B family protein n=1 Tax=Specibacter cremeus TaxID=1629051 RepID=UPI000F77E386|nr:carboxyltransferase domain-containing protein [Specibacter cremeus]